MTDLRHDDVARIDPELEADLGAEFPLRGDQLEAEAAAARTELEAAQAEAAANLETAQRLQAELENFRKRVVRDQADAVKRAGERVVVALLPIVDNLERALAHAGDSDPDLHAGVEMVLGQLLDVLAKEGVEQLDPQGEPFDAMLHQAVGQKEDVSVADSTVAEVFQKGYEMHGRVIRPAMVVVTTGGPAREE